MRANSSATQRNGASTQAKSQFLPGGSLLETSAMAQPKHRRKDCEGHAQQAENPGRSQRIDIAVLMHHGVDPRHGKRIENHAVQETVEQAGTRARAEAGKDQQANGNPREKREIVVGKGKRESGAARDREQQPHIPGQDSFSA